MLLPPKKIPVKSRLKNLYAEFLFLQEQSILTWLFKYFFQFLSRESFLVEKYHYDVHLEGTVPIFCYTSTILEWSS